MAEQEPPVLPSRSALMARIGSKNTKPEMVVRRLLHALGYRFRLHAKELPGRPDIVFRSKKKAIFVHGCFWHRHSGCSKSTTPKTRTEFWSSKFDANINRDLRNQKDLEKIGWDYLVVWECEVKDHIKLSAALQNFLGATVSSIDCHTKLSIQNHS
ncbi:very short patch repair endonuclease [Azospirillum sp. B2RO_4]|uniref:very short patch repair endonuclease n=1 Tax=Azospirillum sp. B2RO_4 TaxID=3027796 RepID=UPI003DAA3DB1